ncbi:MAG: diguanylate cyclase [Pseudobutyrivibrio sp.]|nr:diguanylate cyclase [Pseudobutyrivibrio sp.]
MTNSERIYNSFFYMGISKEQFHKIKYEILEDNRLTVSAGAVCTSLFWIISLILSTHSNSYYACRIVYIVALVVSLVCLLGARFLIKRRPGAILVVVTLFSFMFLSAGIGIAYCQPDVRTATMIAFAIIVPTLIIKNTITDIIMELITIIAYIILCNSVIQPDIYYWGLTNLFIFSVAGILIGHFINKERCGRFVNAESARELAEVQKKYAYCDPLTGLKNRRAFEEKLNEMESSKNDYSIVMLDLNGLKRANDTLGHEAGDELLVAASMCLVQSFNGCGSIYRIGGDEFCVIFNGSLGEVNSCLASLETNTANWKGKYINSFSISYGVALSDDEGDISSLIKLADQKMYENKRNYYKKEA